MNQYHLYSKYNFLLNSLEPYSFNLSAYGCVQLPVWWLGGEEKVLSAKFKSC